MTLTRKDLSAAVLTTLVVLTYMATYQAWSVPLVGDSRRWAAGVVLLLGVGACGMGSQASRRTMVMFGIVGTLALLCAVLALWTASLTPLSFLVLCVVVLFVTSTVRHATARSRRAVPTPWEPRGRQSQLARRDGRAHGGAVRSSRGVTNRA